MIHVKKWSDCVFLLVLHLSLIHFESVFRHGVEEFSNFISLHIAVQFSQHHSALDEVAAGAWVCF